MIFANVDKAGKSRVISHLEFREQTCFGANAMLIEYSDATDLAYARVVYDSQSQEIFLITLEVPGQPQCFRWINPDYQEKYIKELESQGTNPTVAWDAVEFTEITDEVLILEYMKDIEGGYYDNLPIVETDAPAVAPWPTQPFESKKEMTEFTVNLDVRLEFNVNAESMDDALRKAKNWYTESKMTWNPNDDVSWHDSRIVKEAVERREEW